MMTQHVDVIAGERYALPTIMRKAGLNDAETQIGVVGMWWSPDESNPDSAITHVIVKGVQNLLRRLGVGIKATGFYGEYTHKALVQILGRQYTVAAWEKVYEALIAKIARKEKPQVSLVGSDFVPTRYPTSGYEASGSAELAFRSEGGAYTGEDQASTDAAKGLQTQLNRYASQVGFNTLDVDGAIGNATANALIKTSSWITRTTSTNDENLFHAASIDTVDDSFLQWIAMHCDDIGYTLQLYANTHGLAAPSSKSSGGGGGGPLPPFLTSSGSSFPILPAALGLGALWFLLSKPKKGRKKKGWF